MNKTNHLEDFLGNPLIALHPRTLVGKHYLLQELTIAASELVEGEMLPTLLQVFCGPSLRNEYKDNYFGPYL